MKTCIKCGADFEGRNCKACARVRAAKYRETLSDGYVRQLLGITPEYLKPLETEIAEAFIDAKRYMVKIKRYLWKGKT